MIPKFEIIEFESYRCLEFYENRPAQDASSYCSMLGT